VKQLTCDTSQWQAWPACGRAMSTVLSARPESGRVIWQMCL